MIPRGVGCLILAVITLVLAAAITAGFVTWITIH